MADDVSRNVVAILLVLVVLVSALGTWAFLSSFQKIPAYTHPESSGDVNLRISDGSSPQGAPGHVVLEITQQEAS